MKYRFLHQAVTLLLVAGLLPGDGCADDSNATPSPEELQEQLLQQQQRIAELDRLVRQQMALLEKLQQQLAAQANPPTLSPVSASVPATPTAPPVRELERLSGDVDALAEHNKVLNEKFNQLEKKTADSEKNLGNRLRQLGNFAFSGDVRLRYEPFFQGGGFRTRHRERARARLNITGKLSDELSGGISFATGSLDDVNSPNQTLTGFFTRKAIGFDRYYLMYKPNWFKPLSLAGGKFSYPWFRTPLTFDNDINPEGFAQTFSFDFENPTFRNLTLVGFQLPFNEASGAYDSFILGGQLQTGWRLSDRVGLRLFAAGVNINRADPIAIAVARGELRPSLPNTNQFRTNTAGEVVGYVSKFAYLDLIGVFDYRLHRRFPMQLMFDFVNNTRAATRERSGYWGEIQFGRLSEVKDVQFGYTLVRIEREAVIGAFNESDLRASTNVRNHRVNFGYQAARNVSLTYTVWLGRLANPQDNATQVPPDFRPACSTVPFSGCEDPLLKRMQFDVVYKF